MSIDVASKPLKMQNKDNMSQTSRKSGLVYFGSALVFFLAWVGARESFARSESREILIYFLSNREAEIEPCGCEVRRIGGLNRVATFLTREKIANPSRPSVVLDGGDCFFPFETVNPTFRKRDLAKAELIADAMALFKVDVIVPGERDFAFGMEALRKLSARAGAKLVTNIRSHGAGLGEAGQIVARDGVRVGIAGVADPKLFQASSDFQASLSKETLAETLRDLRKRGAELVVVVSHMNLEATRELATMGQIDVVIGGHSTEPLFPALRVGNVPLVAAQGRGKQIGILKFDVDKKAMVDYRLIDLDETFDQDNPVARMMKKYRKAFERDSAGKTEGSPQGKKGKP